MNYPDTQQQHPSQGKLVLPAPGESQQPTDTGTQRIVVRSEQLIRHQTPPAPLQLLPKLSYFWRKDPAYKVLMIALATVVIAGTFFLLLAGNALSHTTNLFSFNSTTAQDPSAIAPTGTVNFRPSFPTPGGGQGSDQNSQPSVQSTPVLQPTTDGTPGETPTAQPSPNPNGSLTVDITSVPRLVSNGSRVTVGVTTNEPDVKIQLYVVYNVPPYNYVSSPRTTDGGGNGSLSWHVQVSGFGRAVAQLTVVAVDQNGQQASSSPVYVQIV